MKEIFRLLSLILIGTSVYVILNTGTIFSLFNKSNKDEDRKFDRINIIICLTMLIFASILYIISFLF